MPLPPSPPLPFPLRASSHCGDNDSSLAAVPFFFLVCVPLLCIPVPTTTIVLLLGGGQWSVCLMGGQNGRGGADAAPETMPESEFSGSNWAGSRGGATKSS